MISEPEAEQFHAQERESQMRKNKITNFLLLLIAIALITIAIRPYLAPGFCTGSIRFTLSVLH
jgi:hypothetical protein